MASSRPLFSTLALGIAGAVIGLMIWALLGAGFVELGILDRFDPFDLLEEPANASTATKVAEWSYPAFALFGFCTFPQLIRWLVKPPEGAS